MFEDKDFWTEFLNNLKNERSNLQVYDSTETDVISDDVNIKINYNINKSKKKK